jgi:hypothetical protein
MRNIIDQRASHCPLRSVARLRKFAPQRREERKEERRRFYDEKQLCLSLPPSRLCGASFFDPATLSLWERVG